MKVAAVEKDIEKVLISETAIKRRVKELAAEISKDYRDTCPLLIGVLRGAIVFLADLAREISIPVQIDFIAISSYGSRTKTSGVVRILKDLEEDIKGRDVIVVEDIVDTVLTLSYLLRGLRARKPNSVEVCALLDKQSNQRVSLEIKYCGFEVPDKFVVGYGLDYAQNYRNLSSVCTLKSSAYNKQKRA